MNSAMPCWITVSAAANSSPVMSDMRVVLTVSARFVAGTRSPICLGFLLSVFGRLALRAALAAKQSKRFAAIRVTVSVYVFRYVLTADRARSSGGSEDRAFPLAHRFRFSF